MEIKSGKAADYPELIPETPPPCGKVWAALAAVQGKLHNARLDSKNPHFKSEYASLESYIDEARPILAAHELSLIQGCTMYGTEWVLTTQVTHADGSHIDFVVPLLLAKNDMQGLGSAMTYARRYGIAAILNMGSRDDDGAETTLQAKNESPKAEPPRTFRNFAPKGPAMSPPIPVMADGAPKPTLRTPKEAAEYARNTLKWTSDDFKAVWGAYGVSNYAALKDYKEQKEFMDAVTAGASAKEIVKQKTGNDPKFDLDEKLPF